MAWNAPLCPNCQADYGPGAQWRPLADNEAEEAEQLRREPHLRRPLPSGEGTPAAVWKVERMGDGVRLRHENTFEMLWVSIGFAVLFGLFSAALVLVEVESTFEEGLWAFLLLAFLMPAMVLPSFIWPMIRGRRYWDVFPSGLVVTRGRLLRGMRELGAPLSVMAEPLDRRGAYVSPESIEGEWRLAFIGPKGRVLAFYAPVYVAVPLRDALRQQLKAIALSQKVV
jgi:hypothetical protein